MLSIVSRGATQPLADAVLEALTAYNATAYVRAPTLRRIDALPLVYRPDERGPVITLVAADMLEGHRAVSCGTAAAAWAGWARSRGATAHVRLSERGTPGYWHAVAVVDGKIWDPARELRREKAWAI